ncbi:hypothetical protein CTheo_7970 [Ceratobasidium theobromae]|uniref:Uncharacterized protein n=1 Tax=Ceratobasidium theobromae TaxID=1582974 RepID=A0A5N5Q9X5_9AGAM|nr:hypothetical protein CTheo_7970 [Ceratobasidium theobromae]
MLVEAGGDDEEGEGLDEGDGIKRTKGGNARNENVLPSVELESGAQGSAFGVMGRPRGKQGALFSSSGDLVRTATGAHHAAILCGYVSNARRVQAVSQAIRCGRHLNKPTQVSPSPVGAHPVSGTAVLLCSAGFPRSTWSVSSGLYRSHGPCWTPPPPPLSPAGPHQAQDESPARTSHRRTASAATTIMLAVVTKQGHVSLE